MLPSSYMCSTPCFWIGLLAFTFASIQFVLHLVATMNLKHKLEHDTFLFKISKWIPFIFRRRMESKILHSYQDFHRLTYLFPSFSECPYILPLNSVHLYLITLKGIFWSPNEKWDPLSFPLPILATFVCNIFSFY